MKEITQFVNEEGFELKGYISELFERVSDEDEREEM